MSFRLGVLAGAGLLALMAAACDDGEGEPAAAPATPTQAAMTAATPDGASAATVSVSNEGELAPFLVGPEGGTLYIFTNDTPGVSNCSGGCLENWPPLIVEGGAEPTAGEGVTAELGTIEREDGRRQVTLDEMPLYYFARDEAPGDTRGHEVGGVWFVARPDGAPSAAGNGSGMRDVGAAATPAAGSSTSDYDY